MRNQVINESLRSSNLTAAEEKMAREPGLNGRIWHVQGLIFDEGYGILMLLGILTDPKQANRYSMLSRERCQVSMCRSA